MHFVKQGIFNEVVPKLCTLLEKEENLAPVQVSSYLVIDRSISLIFLFYFQKVNFKQLILNPVLALVLVVDNGFKMKENALLISLILSNYYNS